MSKVLFFLAVATSITVQAQVEAPASQRELRRQSMNAMRILKKASAEREADQFDQCESTLHSQEFPENMSDVRSKALALCNQGRLFNSARQHYVDGANDACLEELKAVHAQGESYKNSQELERFCQEGKELEWRKADLQRKEEEFARFPASSRH